jgi:hypothetical protein
MPTLRSALPAALILAILHLLTVRVTILPGVTVPVAALVFGAELAAVALIVRAIVRQICPVPSRSRRAW